ncbi:hypothetical protein GCM10010452_31430 [Crossiella cryophila]
MSRKVTTLCTATNTPVISMATAYGPNSTGSRSAVRTPPSTAGSRSPGRPALERGISRIAHRPLTVASAAAAVSPLCQPPQPVASPEISRPDSPPSELAPT